MKQLVLRTKVKRVRSNFGSITAGAMFAAALGVAVLVPYTAYAAQQQQPPAPCHPNPHAEEDRETILNRGDIRRLPDALENQLAELAGRPHSQLPTQAFAEADQPSQLFQYYLLDTTGFEPNPFTSLFPGINDKAMLTATGPNCGLPTIGSVREVLEPKPGLPTDPNNVRAFIDVFTDVSGLFVINNESGWYEGWMIHDLRVAPVGPPLMETRFTSRAAPITFPIGRPTSCPSNSAWAPGTRCRRAMGMPIGSLITQPTGYTHCMSFLSPEGFTAPSRQVKSVRYSRSSRDPDRQE